MAALTARRSEAEPLLARGGMNDDDRPHNRQVHSKKVVSYTFIVGA